MVDKGTLSLLGKGFCMGTADVIPGVSGGTMALLLGIYQRLLEAIRSFDLKLLRILSRGDWRLAIGHVDVALLLPLGVGIFAALMFFTRVVSLPGLIHSDPEAVFGFFFGLIAASVGVLLKSLRRFESLDYLFLVGGVVVGWLVVNIVPVSTPEASWFIVISGALAISALLLPGISGSFILLILKKYTYILNAIGTFDFSVIIPFALGAAFGLITFSRGLSWLLRHYYQRALAAIIGVLIGSLWVIWPFQERSYEMVRDKPRLVSSNPVWPSEYDSTVLISFALLTLGIGLASCFHLLSRGPRA